MSEAKELGRAVTREARTATAEDLRHARQTGTAGVESARAGAEAAGQSVRDQQARLAASTVSPDALQSDMANTLRAVMGHNAFRAIGLLRLLSGAKASDIIEWAAHSTPNTQRMVRALLGHESDRGFAALIRDIGGALNPESKPVASHEASPVAR